MDPISSAPPMPDLTGAQLDEFNEAGSPHWPISSAAAQSADSDSVAVSADVPSDITLILELVGLPEKDTAAPCISATCDTDALEVTGESYTIDSVPSTATPSNPLVDDSDEPILVVDESSDDSSSSSSESESSAGPGLRNLLKRNIRVPPQSDNEEEGGATSYTAIATAHEIVQPTVVLPDITEVGADEVLVRVGEVMTIIDSVVVIRGTPRPDLVPIETVLDTDSLLVFDNRRVLGQVFETFGPLKQPMYSVRFPDAKAIDKDMVILERPVYHVPRRSFFVSSNSLHTKGSDASNFYDEEPGDEELEFSDDEQEAEYRRALKNSRRKDHPSARNTPALDPYDENPMSSQAMPLPYDEDPYTIVPPETRPPVSSSDSPASFQRRGRGRGRNRDSVEHSRRMQGRGRGRGEPRHDRTERPPYPTQRFSEPSHIMTQPDSIDMAIANATGQWHPEFGPAHTYRDNSGYNPTASSSGFYPNFPPHNPSNPPYGYPHQPAQSPSFVTPHINPRFAAQFGYAASPPFGFDSSHVQGPQQPPGPGTYPPGSSTYYSQPRDPHTHGPGDAYNNPPYTR